MFFGTPDPTAKEGFPYENQLEIISPGGFPGEVTAENIMLDQSRRNRGIAEALQRCDLIERAGQGVDLMFRSCIEEGKGRPDYSQSSRHRVRLLLDGRLHHPEFVNYLRRIEHERDVALTLADLLVLEQVRDVGKVRSDQMQRLRFLLSQGLVEKVDMGQSTQYMLPRALYRHVDRPELQEHCEDLDEAQSQSLILEHIRRSQSTGGATFAEFRKVLPGKSWTQVRNTARRLKEAGKARVDGKGRAARWFPGK